MKKIIVLSNNNFKHKQLSLKEYKVEYLNININDLKNNYLKLQADILIINKEYLGNMFNVLSLLVSDKNKIIIYIAKNIEYGQIYNILLEPNFILLKEDNLLSLESLIEYATKIYSEYLVLKKKIKLLEEKNQERELINNAKLKLMKEKGFTEDKAHKYIIEVAMKKRIKKSELAKLIIGGRFYDC